MNSTRRNFVKTSLLGAAGTLLGANRLSAKAANTKPQATGQSFFSPTTDDDAIRQARANIPKIRRREAELLLTDRQGNPLAGKKVEVKHWRHAFLFGDNNVAIDRMIRHGESFDLRLKYFRTLYANVMNALNNTCYWTERPRNDMAKTQEFQGEIELDAFEKSVNWTVAHQLTAKGHPLFWTVEKAIPKWLQRYPYSTQMKFVEVRIRNMVSRFKGRVKVWDAVNEMLWEPTLQNLPERQWPHIEKISEIADYVGNVLRWGREEDPEALFVINDYGLSMNQKNNLRDKNGTLITAGFQRKRMLKLIEELKQRGQAPGAVGLQSHSGWFMHKEQIEFYDQMAQTGLPLHVTEFSVGQKTLENSSPETKAKVEKLYGKDFDFEQMLADYVENYMTCAFGHPAVENFFFWGFMRMATQWQDANSPSYRLTPVYHRVKKLLKQDWTTHETLTSDSKGKIRFSGYLGDYTLRYKPQPGATTQGVRFALNKQQTMPLKIEMQG